MGVEVGIAAVAVRVAVEDGEVAVLDVVCDAVAVAEGCRVTEGDAVTVDMTVVVDIGKLLAPVVGVLIGGIVVVADGTALAAGDVVATCCTTSGVLG